MGKSCKGCLYYSSLQKAKSNNPTCIGFSTTLQKVPDYIVGETEFEASKEGRSFTDFKYACVGYSVFLDNKDSSPNDPQNKQAELPFCVGLEVLLDKRPEGQTAQTHAPAHASTHAHKSEGISLCAWKMFKRNAILVASGVARNVNRVCSHIKESLDDILYPYRRRPK
ncbi:hypothetical protein CsatA_005247 [Cannabis sativa]